MEQPKLMTYKEIMQSLEKKAAKALKYIFTIKQELYNA